MTGLKKFIIKLFIFSIPFIIFGYYSLKEIIFLPPNYYTFRPWEALAVHKQNNILTGPFYPNKYLATVESGDITGEPEVAVLKDVVWYTDQYGFRKKPSKQNPKIVIVGDSFTAGAALSQDDMLSEQLEKRLGVSVYPYAPANFTEFVQDPRFIKHPPDIVIFEATEKIVRHIPWLGVGGKEPPWLVFKYFGGIRFFPGIDRFAVTYDRFLKQNTLQYLYARAHDTPKTLVNKLVSNNNPAQTTETQPPPKIFGTNLSTDGRMAFTVQSADKFIEWDKDELEVTPNRLEGYHNYLNNERGVRFIFLPVPNKENIYYDVCVGGKKMYSLAIMIAELKNRGVEVVDLQTAYDKAYLENPDELLYYPDDTHWTPYGVSIAVDLLVAEIVNIK